MTDKELVTQLAKYMLNEHEGHEHAFRNSIDSWRETWLDNANNALSYLTADGRLIPPGGMALAAEQVEDVRKVANNSPMEIYDAKERGLYYAAAARLRALFPATEPAGPCSRGVCSANNGHEGTCAEASGWAEPAEERRSFPTIQDVPNNTLFHTHGGNGSSLFVRNQSGDLRLCLNARPEWSMLLRDEDFPPSSGPYMEVPWSKFPQPPTDPFAQPAPAEPAEEEAKAERDSEGIIRINGGRIVALSCDTREMVQRWFDIAKPGSKWQRDYAAALDLFDREAASSPVVPAPTETGPWHAVAEIPKAVACIKDREGDVWRRCGSGWEHGALHDPVDYAPFVAAEEE